MTVNKSCISQFKRLIIRANRFCWLLSCRNERLESEGKESRVILGGEVPLIKLLDDGRSIMLTAKNQSQYIEIDTPTIQC